MKESSTEFSENKAFDKKSAANAVSTVSNDIGVLRKDLKAIKDDSYKLMKDLKIGGSAAASGAFESIKNSSLDEIYRVEKLVKARPARSVALAFLSGVVLSRLMSSASSSQNKNNY